MSIAPASVSNLFSGLCKYSLKPEKEPLENFCTELLAWCLQNSPKFRREFLKLSELPQVLSYDGAVEVETQQSFAVTDSGSELVSEEEKPESGAITNKRRIVRPDLGFRSAPTPVFA